MFTVHTSHAEMGGRPIGQHSYSILNVYSKWQGNLRLRIFVLWLFFVWVGFPVVFSNALLGTNTADKDARDMIVDYRATRKGIQNHHDEFSAAQFRLRISGSSAVLEGRTESGGLIEDPRAPFVDMANTNFRRFWEQTSSTRRARMEGDPETADEQRRGVVAIQIEERGSDLDETQFVRLMRTSTDYDTGTITISTLATAIARVYLFEGRWFLLDIQTEYEESWSGPLAGAAAQFASLARNGAQVQVRVEDVAQATRPAYPQFTSGITGLFVFPILLLGLGILLLLIYVFFQYQIRRNSALNHGLPPPFFAGMRQFRGW